MSPTTRSRWLSTTGLPPAPARLPFAPPPDASSSVWGSGQSRCFRLTDGAHPLASLDDGQPAVLEGLSRLAAAPAEAMGPLETLAQAAGLLQQTGAPFSAVVVIAAGNVDASVLVRGELLPTIINSGAAVHVVQAQVAGDGTADAAATDLLRVVADQTRGQFTAIYSSASYEAALDRLAGSGWQSS